MKIISCPPQYCCANICSYAPLTGNYHYHHGMQPGENTLEAMLARKVVMRGIQREGRVVTSKMRRRCVFTPAPKLSGAEVGLGLRLMLALGLGLLYGLGLGFGEGLDWWPSATALCKAPQ